MVDSKFGAGTRRPPSSRKVRGSSPEPVLQQGRCGIVGRRHYRQDGRWHDHELEWGQKPSTGTDRRNGGSQTLLEHSIYLPNYRAVLTLLCKLTVLSKQGKEAVVAILGTGDFFGEGCLAGQSIRMATAIAMTDCSVMRLEKAAVVLLLHEEPAFAELFVAHLLHSGMPSPFIAVP